MRPFQVGEPELNTGSCHASSRLRVSPSLAYAAVDQRHGNPPPATSVSAFSCLSSLGVRAVWRRLCVVYGIRDRLLTPKQRFDGPITVTQESRGQGCARCDDGRGAASFSPSCRQGGPSLSGSFPRFGLAHSFGCTPHDWAGAADRRT